MSILFTLRYVVEFSSEIEHFHTKVIEKIKIHILSSTLFFMPKILMFIRQYDKYGKSRQGHMTLQLGAEKKPFECRKTKAEIETHTLRICNTYCFSGQQ